MKYLGASGSEALMARLSTNYEGVWDPRVKCKWVLPKRGNTRVWHVALLKEVWEKKKGRIRQLL